MDQVLVVPGPAKDGKNAPPAREEKVMAGEAVKENEEGVAVVKHRVPMPTRRPGPINPTTRFPDGPLQPSRKGVAEMPGFDGTGPEFAGPLTGGARGWCGGDHAERGVGYGAGVGFGHGRRNWRQDRGAGAGYGPFGNRFQSRSLSRCDNQTLLRHAEQQASIVQQRLDAINARIESLKTNAFE